MPQDAECPLEGAVSDEADNRCCCHCTVHTQTVFDVQLLFLFCGFRSSEFLLLKSELRESFVFFTCFYCRLFRSCGFIKGRRLDSASFFGKILPPCGCGDFPENPCGLNLPFQDAGLPLPLERIKRAFRNTMRRFAGGFQASGSPPPFFCIADRRWE